MTKKKQRKSHVSSELILRSRRGQHVNMWVIIGAACGLAVIVVIYYWEEITGTKGISFLCALPLGLLTQIVVGMLASLLREKPYQ